MDRFLDLLPLLIPLLLIQLSLQIYSIVDLIKREKVRFDNKLLWGAVIILFNVIGPVIYLVFGRSETG
jgi:hypothetical protein